MYRDAGNLRTTKGLAGYKTIFATYAEEHRECKGEDEAAELFYRHREFLMAAMMRGKEGLSWGHTPFYMHLKGRFPEEFKRTREKVDGKALLPSAPASRSSKGSSNRGKKSRFQTVETDSVLSKSSASSRLVPKKDEDWWKASAVWTALQRAQLQGLMKPEDMTVAALARILVRQHRHQ